MDVEIQQLVRHPPRSSPPHAACDNQNFAAPQASSPATETSSSSPSGTTGNDFASAAPPTAQDTASGPHEEPNDAVPDGTSATAQATVLVPWGAQPSWLDASRPNSVDFTSVAAPTAQKIAAGPCTGGTLTSPVWLYPTQRAVLACAGAKASREREHDAQSHEQHRSRSRHLSPAPTLQSTRQRHQQQRRREYQAKKRNKHSKASLPPPVPTQGSAGLPIALPPGPRFPAPASASDPFTLTMQRLATINNLTSDLLNEYLVISHSLDSDWDCFKLCSKHVLHY